MSTHDIYGGWQPTTEAHLAECVAEPYITPVGVTPQWVLDLRAAVAGPDVCRCGRFPVRRPCTTCNPQNSAPDTPSPVPGAAAARSVADASTGGTPHNHCTTN